MKWGPLLSYKLSDPGKLSPHDSMKFALSPKLAPKFFSLSKIHTMFYTLIKFHKCFIDDNFWMGLLFQLGRNTFFNLDQFPLIQKYNNRTPEQNYNIYIPLNQQLLVISISDKEQTCNSCWMRSPCTEALGLSPTQTLYSCPISACLINDASVPFYL